MSLLKTRLEEARIAVSDQLQIPQESIKLLNYCGYGYGHINNDFVRYSGGIIVMTNDAIHLVKGRLEDLDFKEVTKLDLQNIKSVEYVENYHTGQLQIIHDKQMLVIYVGARLTLELNQQLYNTLIHAGIPKASRNQIVGLHTKYDPVDGRTMADLPGPTNYQNLDP